MEEELLNIKNAAVSLVLDAKDRESLEEVKVQFLGRSGQLTLAIKKIPQLNLSKRKEVGMLANEVKKNIEESIVSQESMLRGSSIKAKVSKIDKTIPGIPPKIGHLHPLTHVLNDVINVFQKLGYQVADGPEIETDYYNFEALNIPKDHPARDTQQTFYIDTAKSKISPGQVILRTQTSAMQGRIMEKTKPPIRVIVPGKNYRYEQVDASHGFEFWQVEGFLVDRNVKLTDLFGTIEFVLRELMGKDIKLKFATTNFPFVEPGVDTYIECTVCRGKGCSFCKMSGWSEIMPAGMIHPNVLKAAKLDPREVSGFAFAIGLSRLVTLRYQMSDLRLLINPDLRIINQF